MKKSNKACVFSVPRAVLNINKKYDYPIYRKVDEKIFRILLDKNNVYDERKDLFIRDENIEQVFIDVQDKLKYQDDIQEHISNIIDDDNISLNIKAGLINDIAKETVNDLFENELDFKKLQKVDNLLSNSIDFILKDDTALDTMLKITSYDYYTYTHCIDVSTYCMGFGLYLGLNKDDVKLLGKAGMLHDIGKKYIDRSIICKKGRLTKEEIAIVQRHPVYSAQMLQIKGEPDIRLLRIVEQHHEKCDGTGYPKGLQEHEIDDFAKIVSICDIFNALTTRRTYKDRMTTYDAIMLMYEKMGNELCLFYLEKFVKFLKLS